MQIYFQDFFLDKYPLSIFALFNEKTLDYQIDNQAFVAFCETPQYKNLFSQNPSNCTAHNANCYTCRRNIC
jgi:hypothetical protein